jgi:hypothetical protein
LKDREPCKNARVICKKAKVLVDGTKRGLNPPAWMRCRRI